MYRPEGLKENPNPCLECDDATIPDRVCDMTCIRLCKYETTKAAYDAMLEGLEAIDPDVIFQWYKFNDYITPKPLTYRGQKGKLVFIPEEE